MVNISSKVLVAILPSFGCVTSFSSSSISLTSALTTTNRRLLSFSQHQTKVLTPARFSSRGGSIVPNNFLKIGSSNMSSSMLSSSSQSNSASENIDSNNNNSVENNSNVDVDADVDVSSNLEMVRQRISSCLESCNRPLDSVRLVAVSKTKPEELLMKAYESGQRHFGENYVQELVRKASTMPSDISWHFIGPLQSNKAGLLVKSVGLERLTVESVSTLKLAKKLNNAAETWLKENASGEEENASDDTKAKKLAIYLQVNTSNEASKSGAKNDGEILTLAKEVVANCPNLRVDGIMTIGAPGDYSCFDTLASYQGELLEILPHIEKEEMLGLSMGMSGDFEEAIKRGSTSIRVGSTIFGARDYSNK